MIALSLKRNKFVNLNRRIVTFRLQIWVECIEFFDKIVTFKIGSVENLMY